MARSRGAARGFTLVELLVALTLLAMMASVLFGALQLAGRSWEGGEAKAAQVATMRQTEGFLRAQLEGALPKRMARAPGLPLLFAGTAEELRYVATLPERVVDGGTLFFRLALAKDDERGQLVLERMIPDPDAAQLPEFTDAERTVIAEDIAELRFAYFGRDAAAAPTDAPTWRDQWEDTQRLPMLVRVTIRPKQGAEWPPLVVAMRRALEAGCRALDANRTRCLRV
jgi:general secretion pathway protein J